MTKYTEEVISHIKEEDIQYIVDTVLQSKTGEELKNVEHSLNIVLCKVLIRTMEEQNKRYGL